MLVFIKNDDIEMLKLESNVPVLAFRVGAV